MNKKIPQSFQEWLNKNNLTIFEALSIAYVPIRSYENIIEGKMQTSPAKQRLFLLTELPLFAFSQAEQIGYQKLKDKTDAQMDYLIASKFITAFKDSGSKPDVDDSLCLSSKQRQDKESLSKILYNKYFTMKNLTSSTTIAHSTKKEISYLDYPVQELKNLFEKGDKQQIKNFFEKNKMEIKTILQLCQCFTSTDPIMAYKTLSNSFNFLNQK